MKQKSHKKGNGLNPPHPSTESLRTSEIRYRRLFEAARDGILILDADSRITDVNPFMSDLLGYSYAEFMGKELWEIGFFADKDASRQAIAKLNAAGHLRMAILPLKTSTGELRDIEFIGNVYEEDGKRVTQCNIRDNTARERSQVEIRAADERFQSLFEHGPDGIIISSPEKYYLDANESMCRMLGYERDELIGMHAADVVAESEVEFLVPALDEIKSESDYYREWQFRRKDGTEFPCEVLATVMPDGNLLAMIRDITTRKQSVDSLQQQADLLDQSFDAIFTWEVGKQINYWNRGAELLYGFTKAEAIGKASHELLQIEHECSTEEFEAELITCGRWEGELQHTSNEGKKITVESRQTILRPADGRVFVMETNRDITDRKIADTEHQRLADLVQGSNDAIIGRDLKGTIINWNPAAERMFGYSRQEAVGSSFSMLVPSDRVDEEQEILARIVRGEIIDHFATVRIDKFGKSVHISATISPIKDAAGTIIGASKIAHNTSALHRIEEERKAIFEIVRGAITTRDLDEFLKLVHASIAKIVYAENCIVMLHDAATDTFNFAFWTDKHAPPPSESRPVGKSFGGVVLRTGRPLLLTKEAKKRLVDRGEATLAGTPSSSWLGIPLSTEDVVIGVMVVQHYEDENSYDQRDLEFLSSVGDQIALAIERKRAEQSLRESEARYRSVVETASDAIVTMDEANAIVFINNAAEKIFGYSVHEMNGAPVTMLIPDYLNEHNHQGIDNYNRSTHKELNGDRIGLAGLHRDGHDIPLELSLSEFTRDGRRYFTGFIKDVTERRRAEDAQATLNAKIESQRRQLNDLISDVPGIVWEAAGPLGDAERGSNFVSNYVANMLGYSVEEWLATPNFWLNIVHPDDKQWVTEQVRADFAAGKESVLEFRWMRKDGEVIWVEARAAVIRGEDGKGIGVRGVTIDVTERKRAEGARKAISGIIEAAVTTPDLDLYLDLVHRSIGQIIYSENCFVMLYDPVTEVAHYEFWVDKHDERPPAGPLGKGFGSYVLRTSEPLLLTEDSEEKMYERGEAERIGSSSPSWLGVPLRTQSQTIGVLVLQHYEKTNAYSQSDLEFLSSVGDQIALAIERKRAEEALNRSEERYRELVENALDIIYTHDPKGNYTSVNKAGERLTGYSEGEALAMNIADMVAPEFVEKAKVMLAAKLAGDEITAYELEIIAKDGHRIAVEVNTRIIYENGIAVSVQGIARDVTERKRAAAALEESEASFKSLFDTANDAILVMNESVFLACNRRAEILFGCGNDDILDRSPVAFSPSVQPDGRASLEKAGEYIAAAIAGKPQYFEWKHIRADGTPFDAEVSLNKVDFRGAVQIQATVRDVTERMRAEEALRESNEKFHQLADNISDAFWIRSLDMSEVLYISPAFEEIWGRPVKTAYEEPHKWIELILPEDREHVRLAFVALTEEKTRVDIEYRIMRSDGEIRWVRLRGFEVKDEKGVVIRYAGIVTDISESKRAANEIELMLQRLNDAQRMGKIGDWTWDMATGAITWSKEVFEISERDPLLGPPRDYEEYVRPYDAASRELIAEKVAKAIETGEAQEYELALRPDGKHIVYVQAMCEARRDDSGKVFALSGTIQDISARKLAELALKESESRYHSLFENMLEGYAYCDTIFEGDQLQDFVYVEVNGAFETLTGLKNVVGKKVSEILPGIRQADRGLFEIYGRVALTGNPEKFETYLETLGFWLSITVYSSDREHFVAVFDNITERKLASAQLHESRQRLELATDSAGIGIWDWDVVADTLVWDKKVFELYGIAEPDFSRAYSAWKNGIYPEDLERADASTAACLRNGADFHIEFRVLWPNGEVHNIESRAVVIRALDGSAQRMIGVNYDISDRNRANQALQESEDRYRTLFETSPDGVAMFDLNMNVLVANTRSAEIFGYSSAAEMIDKNGFDLIAPRFLDRAAKNFNAIRELGKLAPIESLGIRADGSEFAVEFSATLVRNSDQQPTAVLGVVRDITERKQSEEKLIRSESNLAKSQEIAHLGSWEMDIPDSGDVNLGELRWSDEVFRIFGYTPGEIEVNNGAFFNAVHPGDLASVTEAMAEALRDGKDFRIDHRILLPDGSERSVHEHSEIIVDERSGKAIRIIGTIQDVTSEKQLEEQLRHSQKMEAVGVLAGGIAHDFNNLLTAINGYGDLTLRKMPPDDPLRGNVQEIRNAGERAAALTEQLLSFSRKNVLQPKVHNLNPLLTEIEKMLRRIVRENIELRTVLDPELGNINADPGQIEQVIMNLAVNARDAMPNGGTLTIETQNIYLDNNYVSQHIAITPGRFVKMTVTDNGEGMDEKTQRRAFEPFFSTKEVGKGTGLGLSTVFGIVKQSGGDIMVYSEVGHGTSFKIYLPRVDDAVETPIWIEETEEESYSGSETILLVEDEAIVRTLVRDVLKSNGYHVLETASGPEALSVCATYSEPIHLLLTDVIMPKMSGSELGVRVAEERPEIKVLFMSGYTDDAISEGGLLDRGTAFIEKPFSPTDLARKVREVLRS